MKYDCILIVAGHSEAPTVLKNIRHLKQTTITISPGSCNWGSEVHFDYLVKPYEGTDLVIREEDIVEHYQEIKKLMKIPPGETFLQERLTVTKPCIDTCKFREKEYHLLMVKKQ